MGERYNIEKIGERAEPCLTSMSTLKNREEKSFQKYLVFLPTKQFWKKVKTLGSKLALSEIDERR